MATKTKQTQLEVDEETTAQVTETIKGNESTKVLKYDAKVKQHEIETNETEDNEHLDISKNDYLYAQNFPVREIEEIPKDKIEIFFDTVEESLENELDNFYIKITRTPDSFDDDFLKRCSDTVPLGLFGCRLSDRFRITELVQKKNNNSGGRFNFVAYDKNQKPLLVYVGDEVIHGRRVPQTSPIVARDIYIPNAEIQQQQQDNGNNAIGQAMIEIAKMQNENTKLIVSEIQKINQPKEREKSTLEIAIEQKVINDILHPKEAPPQENLMANAIKEAMQTKLMIDTMSQGFAGVFNGGNVNTEPKAWYEKAIESPEVLEFAKSIGMTALNGFNQIMLAKQFSQQQAQLQNQPTPQLTEQPQQTVINPQPVTGELPHQINNPQTQQPTEQQVNQQQQQAASDMQDIFKKIVTELESENPINADNKTLIELKESYPMIYPFLISNVKKMTFDECFSTIQDMLPSEMLDEFFNPITNVLNEKGEKLESRLQELYNYWLSL
jgi:hypothetical protein